MAPDSNAPPAPSQGPPDNTAPEGSPWSWVRTYDVKVHSSGIRFNPFNACKARRQRSKLPPRLPDGYLTRREAAEYLGVSLRFLEGNASIPKVNVAGPTSRRATWRYRKTDLDKWMDARAHNDRPDRGD